MNNSYLLLLTSVLVPRLLFPRSKTFKLTQRQDLLLGKYIILLFEILNSDKESGKSILFFKLILFGIYGSKIVLFIVNLYLTKMY